MFLPIKLHPDGTKLAIRLDLIEAYGEVEDSKGRKFTSVYMVTGGDPYPVMGSMKSFEKMMKFYLGTLDDSDDMDPFVFFPDPLQDNSPEPRDVE